MKECGFPLGDDRFCRRRVRRGRCYQHKDNTVAPSALEPAKLDGGQVGGTVGQTAGKNTRGKQDRVGQPPPVREGNQGSILDDTESLIWLCEALRRHTAGMGSGLRSFEAMQNLHGVAALRRLAADGALPYGVRAVFAGGTCLALGHRLTERYSEDIDVVLVGAGGLGERQREEVLDAVGETLLFADGIAPVGGRRGQLFIQQEFSYGRTVEEASCPGGKLKVRVDAGFADQLPDGDITVVEVETYLSLRGNRPFALQFSDLQPLEVPAVKPRVILIEKMIALHQRATAGQTSSLRSRARDIFDIGCLIEDETTLESLREPGFSAADIDHRQMQRDQKTPSTAPGSERLQIRRPSGGFAESPIWKHGNPMYQALKQSYSSMGGLAYDKSKKPLFDDVVGRVHEIRHLL